MAFLLLRPNDLDSDLARGDAHLAKPHFAKSESAIQESAEPYFAKPGNC